MSLHGDGEEPKLKDPEMQAFAKAVAKELKSLGADNPVTDDQIRKFLNVGFVITVRDAANDPQATRTTIAGFMSKTISELIYLRAAVESILCLNEDIYRNIVGLSPEDDVPPYWPLLRDIALAKKSGGRRPFYPRPKEPVPESAPEESVPKAAPDESEENGQE